MASAQSLQKPAIGKGQIDLLGLMLKRPMQLLALVLLTFIFVLIACLYLYNLFQWSRGPDFGWAFTYQKEGVILTEVYGSAEKMGLRPGDRVIGVNGKRVTSYLQLQQYLNRGAVGENRYEIDRNGRSLSIAVPIETLGFSRGFLRFGFTWVLGTVFLMMGEVVFVMKPGTRQSWAFLLMMFNAGFYIIFSFVSKLSPTWLGIVLIFSSAFLPASVLHHILTFPVECACLRNHPMLLWVPYGISSGLFVVMTSSSPTYSDVPMFWKEFATVYLAVSLLLYLGSNIFTFLRSSSIYRARSKAILSGSILAITLPLADLITTMFSDKMLIPHPVFNLPFYVFFPLSIGYAIVRHNLFDIDTYIKRAVGYILMTVVLGLIYLAMQIGIRPVVLDPLFGEYAESVYPILIALLVVFFFNPVRNGLQKVVDRVFYRLEYNYQETIQKISETMRSFLGLEQIVQNVMQTALGSMFIDSGSVFLLNREKRAYECCAASGQLEYASSSRGVQMPPGPLAESEENDPQTRIRPAGDTEMRWHSEGSPGNMIAPCDRLKFEIAGDDPLIAKLAEGKKEITLYDVLEDPSYEEDRESCKHTFERMGSTLIVPLISKDLLIGLISLGNKKSGRFYAREDIDLLTTLADQGAVAIENARLMGEVIEKERMEEELAIARDLQMSMLPASCPQIEGFEIAALSIPAREVGGDFYDFVEIGQGKMGLVLGDVTGKSVSGALVTAASRSIFRMLAEQQFSVREIMMQANRRTRKDITKGMFVALLFAVIHAETRTLSLSSAGQTQPIHFQAKTGGASLVQTEGDTFPLGILEDADYEETRMSLAPGDKIVFYTDGIVEAMNPQQEIFGFERLLKVVEESSSLAASALLARIMETVNGFSSGAVQHDDLTIVVLEVAQSKSTVQSEDSDVIMEPKEW